MIHVEDARITHFILHHFSQELLEEKIATEEIAIEDEVDEAVIRKLFTKPFTKAQSSYNFYHEVDIDFNVLYKCTEELWSNAVDFVEYSHKVFTHLKNVSDHPKIKDGDVFILEFENVVIHNEKRRAIGIYKVEQKDFFLSSNWENNKQAKISLQEGISSGKLDKACFIVDLPSGPEVYIVDGNKEEAAYWKYNFVSVVLKNDHYNKTQQTMEITQHFIKEEFPQECEVSRVDQADLLNRSMEYFKVADSYNHEEFEEVVLQDENLIESFRGFRNQVFEEQGWSFEDNFEMVPDAVKKNQRFYKSVIKLDKNFHIYVHGNKEMIEQGVDEQGRKYYKLYFEEEH